MDEQARSWFRWRRDGAGVDATPPPGITVRRCRPDDDVGLGQLIERAYAGTIDADLGDNSDGQIEMAMWRDEPADAEASFVAVDDDGVLRSASLLSGADDAVYVAYAFTHPEWKGSGVATACVAASLRALTERGETRPVLAAITDGNTPSERLFARVGFERTGPV